MVCSAFAERRVAWGYQYPKSNVLQNQAQGAGWHAEADWSMVNDGQKGPVTGAGEKCEDGWMVWELIA